MIIRVINSTLTPYQFWLPLYLYSEPMSLRYFITSIEFLLYLFTIYVVFVNLRTFLKIQMFHRNFIILGVPMFGLWYELIIGKLITMAYQIKIIKPDSQIDNDLSIWTDNEEKMLIIGEIDGLELLIFAGFLEWHYIFSILFGMVACVSERIIASMLINNYETSTHLHIPIVFLFLIQSAALPFSFLIITSRISVITCNLIWMVICPFGISMYFIVKKLNENWLKEMESPNRKVSFTVSQRFQVRENLRAIALGSRVVYAVLISTVIIGGGVVALIFELVPPLLCHFTENCLFLNPLLICFVTMYSLPAWKQEFRSAFPTFDLKRNERKIGVISVEPMDGDKKKIDKETDIYFEQLNKSWI